MCGTAIGFGLISAASHAQSVPTAPQADETAREWTLNPLYAEFVAERPSLSNHTEALSSAHYLRFEPSDPVFADTISPRPAAARFAGAALGALSDTISRDELAVFSSQETIIATSPTGGQLSLSVFDGERPSMAILAFGADYAEASAFALNGEDDRNRRMALRYEGVFDAHGGSGLDIGLAPRAGFAFGENGAAAEAGVTARLGQYLDAPANLPRWWLFAGADQQAVLYDPGQGFDVREAFAMQPYAIVGDAQAGLAVRLGKTDLSLAYIHRETKYSMPHRSWDAQEGFAAFSLTWKH